MSRDGGGNAEAIKVYTYAMHIQPEIFKHSPLHSYLSQNAYFQNTEIIFFPFGAVFIWEGPFCQPLEPL